MGLKDPQHERFALLVGGGQTPKDAAIALGVEPKEADVTAALMIGTPEIRQRVRDVQEEILRASVVDRVYLLTQLKAAMDGAREAKQWSTLLRAIELAGRMPELNLFPRTPGIRLEIDVLAGLPDEELLKRARKFGLIPERAKPPSKPAEPIEDAQVIEH